MSGWPVFIMVAASALSVAAAFYNLGYQMGFRRMMKLYTKHMQELKEEIRKLIEKK